MSLTHPNSLLEGYCWFGIRKHMEGTVACMWLLSKHLLGLCWAQPRQKHHVLGAGHLVNNQNNTAKWWCEQASSATHSLVSLLCFSVLIFTEPSQRVVVGTKWVSRCKVLRRQCPACSVALIILPTKISDIIRHCCNIGVYKEPEDTFFINYKGILLKIKHYIFYNVKMLMYINWVILQFCLLPLPPLPPAPMVLIVL